MKAVVYEKGNSPDVLVYRDVDKPVPGDNEILIKIFHCRWKRQRY